MVAQCVVSFEGACGRGAEWIRCDSGEGLEEGRSRTGQVASGSAAPERARKRVAGSLCAGAADAGVYRQCNCDSEPIIYSHEKILFVSFHAVAGVVAHGFRDFA